MVRKRFLAILGGGPAGLCTHYLVRDLNYERKLFEATSEFGGNCRTVQLGEFLFDTGAHRLHNKSAKVTTLIKTIVGDDLKEISSPSQVFQSGKFTDFPLSPLNLLRSLGVLNFGIACVQVLWNRLRTRELKSFEDFARHTYGDLIAERFLLDYSEKLWGVPVSELSLDVAGSRLNGLDIRTFILESLFGKKQKTRHLDGTFFYPKYGIGMIFNRIVEHLPKEELASNSAVTRIFHKDEKITSIEINAKDQYDVDEVVSSLPIGVAIKCLDPQPPEHILQAVESIKFRDVLLLMFCIDKESINGNASMYFSSSKDSFTRIYEPRNRSPFMAPRGKTSLAVEVPHFSDDLNDDYVNMAFQTIEAKLVKYGFFESSDVLFRDHLVLKNAYPVLTKKTEINSKIVHDYLNGFRNLTMTGRNGLVQYSHIHDHMENAFKCFDGLKK